LDKFEDRAAQILKDTQNIGWGFHECFPTHIISYMNDISGNSTARHKKLACGDAQ
jgi:hypothetical protein